MNFYDRELIVAKNEHLQPPGRFEEDLESRCEDCGVMLTKDECDKCKGCWVLSERGEADNDQMETGVYRSIRGI